MIVHFVGHLAGVGTTEPGVWESSSGINCKQNKPQHRQQNKGIIYLQQLLTAQHVPETTQLHNYKH